MPARLGGSTPHHRPEPHTESAYNARKIAASKGITLTEEFKEALELLHAGRNVFLTGKAGTGKSTLINLYLGQTDRKVVTVAPTGIAALNVDGMTIHRLFSFGTGVTIDRVRSSRYVPTFAGVLEKLDTLIIDEVSMVRADLFDCIVAALERFGPRPGTPFGGVQLVLVGDLYQLPPVVAESEETWVKDNFGTPFFFSARSFDRADFPTVELSTVFRQKGDSRLLDILNAVRGGELLSGARAELNTRTRPDFVPPRDEFWLTLTTTNARAARTNDRRLESLGNPVREFHATVNGDVRDDDVLAEEHLRIAVGAQVMLLNNHPGGLWANGTLGEVLSIREEDGEPVVTVRCHDDVTVEVGRHTWEVKRPQVANGSLRYEQVGSFTQLPLRLAWAITIHKSQGQTLERVVVDLTGGTFASGQLYVALSRCTTFEGLVLVRDVQPQNLRADLRVREFLSQENSDSPGIGDAYIAVLSVGESGRSWEPRPIEVAVVTEEGDEISTVVNPTSDLYGAKQEFNLSTRDVQLAPLLMEAWPALAAFLADRVPVGVDIRQQLYQLDFELKRNGVVINLPIPREIPRTLLTSAEQKELSAPTAVRRARAVRTAVQRAQKQGTGPAPAGTAFSAVVDGQGYTMARSTGPEGVLTSDGFAVGGHISEGMDDAQVLATLLSNAWRRVTNPDEEIVGRVRSLEKTLGVQIIPANVTAAAPVDLDAVLSPGAHVCFTGTVTGPDGPLSKEELHSMAEIIGLVPEADLTKSRTDVLVVAEAGSQSSKAKKAAKWNKPVVVADDFLAWQRRN